MQQVLVIITVSAAFIYLLFKGYKAFFSKNKPCEGCSFSKPTAESIK